MKNGIFVFLAFVETMIVVSFAIAQETTVVTHPKALYAEQCGELWCLVLETPEKTEDSQFIISQNRGELIARRPDTDYPVKKVRVVVEGDISNRGMTLQEIVMQAWNGDFKAIEKTESLQGFGFMREKRVLDVFSVSSISYEKVLPEIEIKSRLVVEESFSGVMLIILASLFSAFVSYMVTLGKTLRFFILRIFFSSMFLSAVFLYVVGSVSLLMLDFPFICLITLIPAVFLAVALEFVSSKIGLALAFVFIVIVIFFGAGIINALIVLVTAIPTFSLGIYLQKLQTKRVIKKMEKRRIEKFDNHPDGQKQW